MIGFGVAAAALLVAVLWLLAAALPRAGTPAAAGDGRVPDGSAIGRALVPGLMVGVPVASLLLYGALGRPDALLEDGASAPRLSMPAPTAAPGSRDAGGAAAEPDTPQAALAELSAARRAAPAAGPDIDTLLARLTRRLQDHPDDADGWTMLANSQASLGRYAEAVAAYERAAALRPQDAQLLADWADALAMSQGGRAAGAPARLIERALQADPAHPKALVMAGMAALERGDAAQARRHFQRARDGAADGSELAQAMDRQLAELERAAPAR